mgnify:CR=1 FL=1
MRAQREELDVTGLLTILGATLDLTLRYTSPDRSWYLEAFGYNVTDERFQTYLSDWADAGRPLFAWNRPRSYGVRFAYNLSPF